MKETLDEESRNSLIKYRLERARQTIEEAKALEKSEFYNASVNRLYYAVYYATLALFLAYRISAKTHAGVKSMLGLHFISNGILPKTYGKTFNDLFNLRQSGDYDDFVYSDKETVEEYIPKANAFINEVETLLKDKG